MSKTAPLKVKSLQEIENSLNAKTSSSLLSPNNSFVKIGEASKLLGVSIDTLRRWEKRGWLRTIKTPGGTRLYDKEQLQKLNPNLRRGPKSLLTPISQISLTSPVFQTSPLPQTQGISLSTDQPVLKTMSSLETKDFEDGTEDFDLNFNDNGFGSSVTNFFKISKLSLLALVISFILLSSLIIPFYIASNYLKENQKLSSIGSGITNNPIIQGSEIAEAIANVISPNLSKKFFGTHPPGLLPGNLANFLSPASERDSAYIKDHAVLSEVEGSPTNLGQVLAESSPSGSFLEINLDTVVNGLISANEASVSGTLAVNKVPYTFPASQGEALTFLQNDGTGTLAWTGVPLPGNATTTTTGLASFSDSFFTVSTAGAVALKEGGITTTEILNGTIANGDLASSSITISPGSGMSGGGAVSLGGSVTITSVLGSTVSLTSEVEGVLPVANGGSAKALTLAAGGVLWTDADSFEVSAAGTTGQCLQSAGTSAPTWASCTASAVSGTTNTIAKFTSATTVGDSSITDNGTTVALSSIFDANGQVDLGDGGDAIAISGTTVSITSNTGSNDITLTSADDILFRATDIVDIGNGTDSLQISAVGDLLFVDADGGASITGPAGGALTISGANSQALNLTTTTAGNISLDPAGTGDIAFTLDTDGSVVTITDTANTSNDSLTISASALTTGSALVLTGPSGGTAGVTDAALKISSDVGNIGTSNGLISSTATFDGTTATGVNLYLTSSDAIAAANVDYGIYNSVTNTGAIDSAIIKTSYGNYTSVSSTLGAPTTAGTTNVYGQYITTTATHAADFGTVNNYGLYLANGTSSTNGTSTKYGIYIEDQSGADTYVDLNFSGSPIVRIGDAGVLTFTEAGGNNTLCTLTDNSNVGDLTCTGTITGVGAVGYWTKASTTLSPATANDIVSIANTTTTGADLAITNTGIYTGTGIFNLTANSATLGTIASLSGTALTTGKALALTMGSALTTGSAFTVASASYNHTAGETGSVASLAFTDATTNVVTSTTNGLLVSPTINAGSGAATRTINGISVAPAFTSCGAGTCAVNAINVGSVTDGTGFTGTALKIGTGWDTDIYLQNAETIDNAANGTINLAVDATSALKVGSTGISSIGNVAHTIVDSSGALAIDSATTGAINIGTGANAKTITIGNNTTSTALAFTSGTGAQTFTSSVATGTTTGSAFVFNASALTSGTALRLTSTSTSGKLVDLNATNTSGTIFNLAYGASTTLAGDTTGLLVDLNSGTVVATDQNLTGVNFKIPTVTNTITTGTKTLTGMLVNFGSGAGINQTGAGGTLEYIAGDFQLPALTQTAGTLNAYGLKVTTPSSITTGGTAYGTKIVATGVGAGTLYGMSIDNITGGAGTEYAFNVAGTGWDAVLRVGSTTVINGSGVTQVVGGGTGLATVTQNGVVYGNATSNLGITAEGATGQVLIGTTGSAPSWGTISGSTCTNCLINNPSSDQNISPTGQGTTGLTVRQTSTASPTDDIFQITSSDGVTKYFYVDKDGNVSTGAISNTTLTLTPTSDVTALTLVGTNVTSAKNQYINTKNSSGTIFDLSYGVAQTLAGAIIAHNIDLSTNVTATNQSASGYVTTLPAATNTNTSGTVAYKGLTITGGALNANGTGGTTTFTGADITIPALTQTLGTLTTYGANITTPSSITTGGTATGLNITATGVGAGTLTGINISNITGGAGTEYGLQIGSGWDSNLYLNDTTSRVLLADGATVVIHDGTNTLCTITDSGTTGDLSCTGNITGGSGGTSGFWARASTTLSPATANDIVSIANTTTTGADLAITNTGVYTGTGIFNLTANSATTGTVETISATGLTTGKVQSITATNTATANTAITQALYSLTNAQSTLANTSFVGWGLNFTNNPSVAGNTEYAAQIQNQATSNITDNAVAALLRLDNADTSGTGSTVVTNGILLTNSGGLTGGFTNGITIGSGTDSITTGLNFGSTGITTDISLQNAETIENDVNGTINLAVDATSALKIGSTGISSIGNVAHTIVDSSGALAIDSATTGAINIGTGANAKTITIGNNTTSTALAFTSGTGSQTHTSSVVSGTTTTSAFVFNGSALTSGTGLYATSATLTTGKLAQLSTGSSNVFSTGTLLDMRSTSTGLTGTAGIGSLTNLDWSPGSAVTATGDLFALNIGTNGTTTGNLFNILDASSSIFSVSERDFTTSLPANFTAPGDVSVAYDIAFTNPTASFITSVAPLTIRAGESFNSSNLTLATYNQGSIVFDVGNTTTTALSLSNSTLTTGTGIYASSSSLTSGKLVDLQVSGTAAAASQTGLNILTTGANGTAGITTYGAQISNTHSTNTSTNVALYLNASGGATANYGLIVNAGNVGIGTTTPTSGLQIASTTADSQVYISSVAPRLAFGDNATYASATNRFRIAMATATDNFLGATSSGDAVIFTEHILGSGWASGEGDIIFATPTGNSGTIGERMRIDGAGKVGIGDTTPASLLTVGNGDLFQVASTGNIGIGAAPSVSYGLYLAGSITTTTVAQYGVLSDLTYSSAGTAEAEAGRFRVNTAAAAYTLTDSRAVHILNAVKGASSAITNNYGLYVDAMSGGATLNRAIYTAGGSVLFTCTTSASTWTTSQANPSCADYAEVYDSADSSLQQGDLVTIDPNNDGSVKKSSGTPYQKEVVGIYSTSPGMLIGDGQVVQASPDELLAQNKVPVALTGKVPVRATTQNGPIHKGDFLTASSIPGYVMKSTQPGMTVGRALEDYTDNNIQGLLVFVNVTYADPSDALAQLLLDQNGTLISQNSPSSLTVSGDVTVGGNVSASGFMVDLNSINAYGALASLPSVNNKVSIADAINALNDQSFALSNQLSDLEDKQASDSAQIAQARVLSEQAISQTNTLADAVNTTSSSLSSLSSQIQDLLSSLDDSSSGNSQNEQTSNEQLVNDLTPPDTLFASGPARNASHSDAGGSATLANLEVTSEATVSGKLLAYEASIQDTFKSLGQTFLGQTTVAGDLSVDGTLSITRNSINSIGPDETASSENPSYGILFLQNSPLASGIDIFNGSVTINKDGLVSANSLALGEESLGEAIIPAGQTEVIIPTSLITPTSKVFLTPTSSLQGNLFVSQLNAGASFKVRITQANLTPVKFNWLIVQSRQEASN